MAPSLSGRGYAKHRGVTEAAVRKAIKSGRLTRESGSILSDGTIDPMSADREWAQKTDVTKPLNSLTGNPKHRKETPDGPSMPIGMQGADSLPNVGQRAPTGARTRYADNLALREEARAQLEVLKLGRERGQLVLASEVRAAVTASAQRVRDQLLALPDQLDQRLAGEKDPAQVNRILTEELRRCCSYLSSASPAPAGSASAH